MASANPKTRPPRVTVASRHPTPFIALDAADRSPLHRQLYDAIRGAIVSGQLPARSRLPSTRALAEEMGVSRVTVSTAFDQLRAEGYIEAHTGAGTFVREGLPDDALYARRSARSTKPRRSASVTTITPVVVPPDDGQPVRAAGVVGAVAFRTGMPALDLFPVATWARITSRCWRAIDAEKGQLLGYGSSLGHDPLRRAIADYVTLSRGVRCGPRQVIVTGGAQQALDLASRVLLRPGDPAWLEDPGYFGAREALQAAGAHIIPVRVDDEGLDPAAGEWLAPDARLAYVSPSHQFPLGVTMTMRRRLALLDWAARAGAWIIEDDYDGEFRYVGRPLASLQGLDAERSAANGDPASRGRVLYVGTFSKTLFPSLRLGYLIVPETLVDRFAAAKAATAGQTATVEQAVLTDFIEEGHYARHIRRMRIVYANRQKRLIEAASTQLSRWLVLRPASAGMHLVGWLRHDRLPADVSDRALSRAASTEGLVLTALSSYRARPVPPAGSPPARGGLVFGYAGCSHEIIEDGVHRLARAIAAYLETHPGTSRSRTPSAERKSAISRENG